MWTTRGNVNRRVHLSPSCTGLYGTMLGVTAAGAEFLRFDLNEQMSVTDIAAARLMTPCRKCALADVTVAAIKYGSKGHIGPRGRKLFRMISAHETTGSETEQARFAEIAVRTGLSWTPTPLGPVLFGNIPVAVADLLDRLYEVRTPPRGRGFSALAPSGVEMFFEFLSTGMREADAWDAVERVDALAA